MMKNMSYFNVMKNMSYFNVPRSPLGFTDLKIANVFHHPVQA